MILQKGFVPIILIILISVVSLGGYFAYQQVNKSSTTPPPNQVACTEDAKLCPDGTYVSRVPPNCDFSPCPTSESSSSADTSNWKTYTNNIGKYQLKYPSAFNLTEVGYKRGEIVVLRRVKTTESIQIDTRTQTEISLDEWLNNRDKSDGLKTLSSEELLIDGVRVIRRHESGVGAGGIPDEGYIVYLINNSRVFIITGATDNAIFDQILSTFRFLP